MKNNDLFGYLYGSMNGESITIPLVKVSEDTRTMKDIALEVLKTLDKCNQSLSHFELFEKYTGKSTLIARWEYSNQ